MSEQPIRIGKYLSVEKLPRQRRRKTDKWLVLNNNGGYLGTVSWYTQWRQYAFDPDEGTTWAVFNSRCLIDIAAFLKAEMEKRHKVVGDG